ncbi:hypothetical protein NLU13_6138 [Sarocladium strictum]|uniref:Uncharacterized protein n=1 Tax=Sarocladium strictum TaxID=5046 RepID=A0AA39GFN8_SARSR|nr:hypothetical protein NLU13_6138 [Sarocladium strictum]
MTSTYSDLANNEDILETAQRIHDICGAMPEASNDCGGRMHLRSEANPLAGELKKYFDEHPQHLVTWDTSDQVSTHQPGQDGKMEAIALQTEAQLDVDIHREATLSFDWIQIVDGKDCERDRSRSAQTATKAAEKCKQTLDSTDEGVKFGTV